MRRAIRIAAGLTGALALAAALASCAGAAEKTIDHTESSVTLAPGEALIVDFGEINSSVGDEWVITQQPDPAILAPGDEQADYLGEEGETGAPSELAFRFAPAGTGTTVITWEYRFRGSVPEDAADRQSTEITVTVK